MRPAKTHANPPWPSHPIVVLPDSRAYLRPEVGGILLGVQEWASRSFDDRQLPADMTQLNLTDETDWELLAHHADAVRRFRPDFDALQFKHHLAGITTYTPDGRFLIGPTPGVDTLFIAAGCCGTGVSCAGGISRLLCDLILDRSPDVCAHDYSPGRFGAVDPHSDGFIARCVASRANKGRNS